MFEFFAQHYSQASPAVLVRFRDLHNLTISEEKRLARYLLRKLEVAGTDGRPTVNMSTPTEVKFGLALIQLDLDERLKILTSSMWLRLVSLHGTRPQ